MINLITLADFPAYVPFSVNIGTHLVDPHIRDAQTFDVWPLLPGALRSALEAARLDWTEAEIKLFSDFVKPLLVVEAARRMLLWHGLHITPAGSEIVVAQPISSAQRTELRSDLAAKATYYRALLDGALRLAYPPTTTSCATPRRPLQRGGLQTSAI